MNLDEINKLAAVQLNAEELLILRLKASMASNEIADRLGTNRQYVNRILKRAKEKAEAQKLLP